MSFRLWRKKEGESVPRRSLNDIFLVHKKKLLDLHKRYLVIRIDTDFFKDFFITHYRLMSIVGVFLIITIIGSFSGFARADVATFYPSTCLGGWEHPENVEGAPSLTSDSPSSDFTSENSALMQQSTDALYCGGFKGEVPDNTKPTRFRISLLLSVDDGSVVHGDVQPSDNSITAPINTSPNSSNSSPDTTPIPPDITAPTDTSPSAPIPDVSTPPVPDPTATPPAPDSTTPAPTPPTDNTPQSFFYNLFSNIAFAQDSTTMTSADTLSPPSLSTDSTSATDVAPATDSTSIPVVAPTVTSPTDSSSNVSTTPTTLVTTATTDQFLEVDYTLDGTNWNILGNISRSNWKNNSFDIPLSQWTNLENLQIAVKTLPTFDDPSTVYLDSMAVSVDYDNIAALVKPPTVLLKDSASVISSDKIDFSSDEEPTFTVTNPNIDTNGIKALIGQNKAEVVSDPNGVLGAPAAPPPPAIPASPDTTLKQTIDSVNQIITPLSVPPETSAPVSTPSPTIDQTSTPAPTLDTTSTPAPTSSPSSSFNFFETNVAYAQDTPIPPSNISASVLDVEGNTTDISAVVENVVVAGVAEQQVKIQKPEREFRPGHYKLKISMNTSQATIISEQDFTWGVLAVNMNKSVYQAGDDAYIQMGVLNDSGHTICDADLTLDITSPTGSMTELTTDDSSIVRAEECGPDNVIDVPDYYAHFPIGNDVGTYNIKLTANTVNGIKSITDSFDVAQNTPFVVERVGPTRIYPIATYPMTMHITSSADWTGVVTEKVPSSFEISPPDTATTYDSVETFDNDTKIISWNVSLLAGQEEDVGYIFKAPDISPEFYILGPAQMIDTDKTLSFEESRNWEIASDAASTCTSKATGTWIAAGTWTQTSGTGCTGGVGPVAGDTVILASGFTVTVGANAAAASVEMKAAAAIGTGLSISTGVTLTLTGALQIDANTGTTSTFVQTTTIAGTGVLSAGSITIQAPTNAVATLSTVTCTGTGSMTISGAVAVSSDATSGGGTTSVQVGTCTLSAGSISITGGTTTDASVTVSTGTITSGNIAFAGTAGHAKLTSTGIAQMNINTGTWNSGGTQTVFAGTKLTTTGTSAVNLSSANFGLITVTSGALTLGAADTATGITITAGTLTLGAALTVNGNFTNNSGTGAYLGAFTTTITGTGPSVIGGTSATTFSALTLGAAAVVRADTSFTVTNALTFTAATAAQSLTLNGAGVVATLNTVTHNQPGAAFTSAFNINNGTVTESGLYTVAGATSTASFINKIVMTTGTFNANGGLTFVNATTIANHVLDMSGGAGTLNLKGALTVPAGSATFIPGTTSTFCYCDSVAQTINFPPSTAAYAILLIKNTAATGAALSAAITATNVVGNLTVGDGTITALLANGGFAITGAGTATFNVTGNSTFKMTAGSTYPTGFLTFTYAATSTVNYAQTTSSLVITNATYGNLILGPTAAVSFILPATVTNIAGSLTIGDGATAGVVTAATNNPAFNVAGTMTVATLATYTVGNGAMQVTGDLTVTGTLSGSGTGTLTELGNVAGAGTITLTGNTFEQKMGLAKTFGAASGSVAWTFSNLTFSNSTSGALTATSGAGTG